MMVVLFGMIVMMILRQVNIELHSLDVRLLLSGRVQVIAVELQLAQFPFQLLEIRAQVEHGSDEHVAADAAENIEVNHLHFSSPAASALI